MTVCNETGRYREAVGRSREAPVSAGSIAPAPAAAATASMPLEPMSGASRLADGPMPLPEWPRVAAAPLQSTWASSPECAVPTTCDGVGRTPTFGLACLSGASGSTASAGGQQQLHQHHPTFGLTSVSGASGSTAPAGWQSSVSVAASVAGREQSVPGTAPPISNLAPELAVASNGWSGPDAPRSNLAYGTMLQPSDGMLLRGQPLSEAERQSQEISILRKEVQALKERNEGLQAQIRTAETSAAHSLPGRGHAEPRILEKAEEEQSATAAAQVPAPLPQLDLAAQERDVLAERLQGAIATCATMEQRAAEVEDWLSAARAAVVEVQTLRTEPTDKLPAAAKLSDVRAQLEGCRGEQGARQRSFEDINRGLEQGERSLVKFHADCGVLTGTRKVLLMEQAHLLGQLEDTRCCHERFVGRAAALQDQLVGASRNWASKVAELREQASCEEFKLSAFASSKEESVAKSAAIAREATESLRQKLRALHDSHGGLLRRCGPEAERWKAQMRHLQATCESSGSSAADLRKALGAAVGELRRLRAEYAEQIRRQNGDGDAAAQRHKAAEDVGHKLQALAREAGARADVLIDSLRDERARTGCLRGEVAAALEVSRRVQGRSRSSGRSALSGAAFSQTGRRM